MIVHAHAAALLTAAARPGDDDASDAAAQPLITDIKYSGAAWRRLYRQLADVQPQSRDPLVDSATYSGTYSATYSGVQTLLRAHISLHPTQHNPEPVTVDRQLPTTTLGGAIAEGRKQGGTPRSLISSGDRV